MGKLKIVSVGEIKTSKDDRKYFGVELRGSLGSRSGVRQIFQQFKRVNGIPTAEKVWDRGSREEFIAAMHNGELLEGAKETRTVQEYCIPGSDNKLNTYSTIVFADEKVESVFAQSNHPILDEETGQVFDTRKPKAILATASTQSEMATA